MKKISLYFITVAGLFLLSLVLTPVVLGAEPIPEVNIATTESVATLLNGIVKWIRNLAAIFALLMLIIAGIVYIGGAGSSESATKAKSMIIYALIGIAVIVVAQGLILLVGNILVLT